MVGSSSYLSKATFECWGTKYRSFLRGVVISSQTQGVVHHTYRFFQAETVLRRKCFQFYGTAFIKQTISCPIFRAVSNLSAFSYDPVRRMDRKPCSLRSDLHVLSKYIHSFASGVLLHSWRSLLQLDEDTAIPVALECTSEHHDWVFFLLLLSMLQELM
jgi:hypothetical protein